MKTFPVTNGHSGNLWHTTAPRCSQRLSEDDLLLDNQHVREAKSLTINCTHLV